MSTKVVQRTQQGYGRDLLLDSGGLEIRPPEDLTFSVGEAVDLTVEKLHGGQERLRLQLPVPKSRKHPVTAPDLVHAEKLTDEIGNREVRRLRLGGQSGSSEVDW